MKNDIRVDADFVSHPKTQRLIRELGPQAVVSLLALWGYTAKYHPKGVLHGMTTEDIAQVAHWEGEAEQFISDLIRLKWIEKRRKLYSIRGWLEMQPYAFYAPERSQRARKAAETRWKEQCGENTDRNAERNAPAPVPNPIPGPDPPPRAKTAAPAGGHKAPRAAAIPPDQVRGNGRDVEQVILPDLKDWAKRIAAMATEKQLAHGIDPEDAQ